jgi:hypothetical protein
MAKALRHRPVPLIMADALRIRILRVRTRSNDIARSWRRSPNRWPRTLMRTGCIPSILPHLAVGGIENTSAGCSSVACARGWSRHLVHAIDAHRKGDGVEASWTPGVARARGRSWNVLAVARELVGQGVPPEALMDGVEHPRTAGYSVAWAEVRNRDAAVVFVIIVARGVDCGYSVGVVLGEGPFEILLDGSSVAEERELNPVAIASRRHGRRSFGMW